MEGGIECGVVSLVRVSENDHIGAEVSHELYILQLYFIASWNPCTC